VLSSEPGELPVLSSSVVIYVPPNAPASDWVGSKLAPSVPLSASKPMMVAACAEPGDRDDGQHA
jgi:hypothetical protein